jgi:hypothetical protein
MVTVSTIAISCALALVSLGGGFYEVAVVDPSWPRRLDLIQPARGGISRRRFWIPAHVAFEVTLLASLVVAWPETTLRSWLLLALGSHLAMRVWSAFDFIPKALAFERVEPATAQEEDARRWTRRSRLRLPLDLVTCGAMMAAFAAAARLA